MNSLDNITFNTIMQKELVSDLSRKGRGMELSELIYFDNELLGFCDVTGTIYIINQTDYTVRTKTILTFPNSEIPFKYEWATECRDDLYLGSIGKEWVVNGTLIHQLAQYVAVISKSGSVTMVDWKDHYDRIRKFANCDFPGYLQHEAVLYNPKIRRWMFLPRKASSEKPYDEVKDEKHGTNILIITDGSYYPLKMVQFGPLETEWGFTSLKMLPHTDLYIALKVREVSGKTESKLGIFNLDGKLLSKWYHLGKEKYEGLEVLSFK